jgi:hypothetical protein
MIGPLFFIWAADGHSNLELNAYRSALLLKKIEDPRICFPKADIPAHHLCLSSGFEHSLSISASR